MNRLFKPFAARRPPGIREIVEVALWQRYGTFGRTLRDRAPDLFAHLTADVPRATLDEILDVIEARFLVLEDALLVAAIARGTATRVKAAT